LEKVEESPKNVTGLRFGTFLCLGTLFLPAQELADYERRVTEFTLSNGLHFILLERHQIPVVSFHTLVNVGSVQDPSGETGLAHIFEHLAFKGTESVGTRNWAAERKALQDLDEAYDRLDAERNKGIRANSGRMASLDTDVRLAANIAASLEDSGEFLRVFQENGAVGMASHTSPDATGTSYSLPSNRIELWFLMESQRLAHPVLRDFYAERELQVAESSSGVDSKAQPKLQQALLATAFAAHPYRNPALGWPSDISNLRRASAQAFYDTYYVPGNMVIGIVGDVDPANARRMAERYFGVLPAKPLPPLVHTVEPPLAGPKSVTLLANSQPLLMIGYRRPDQTSHDDAAFDVIRTILADGRTSLLYKELVEEKKVAQAVDVTATFPAGRYSNLFVFTLAPTNNRSLEDGQMALDNLLSRFQSGLVDAQALARARNILRARITRVLASNRQLASLLPLYYTDYGDWRKLFTSIGDIERVTAQDVLRVAAQYLTPANRTVAYIMLPNAARGPQ
jgi:predicted Zn-dependent peptidase